MKSTTGKVQQLLSLALLLLLATTVTAITKAGGVQFPDKFKGSSLVKTGVRSKGPIKVYAVGQYGKTFLLQMTYGVSTSKMTSALKAALSPRCGGNAKMVEEFESLMLKGLPNGVPKGTKLAFGCSGGKLSLNVNGKNVGSIDSKPLATAFEKIYTDGNAVCKMKPV